MFGCGSIFPDSIHVIFDKWKNHFSEMKGDVGMSPHEIEKEQEDAHPETESHSTPSLSFVSFSL